MCWKHLALIFDKLLFATLIINGVSCNITKEVSFHFQIVGKNLNLSASHFHLRMNKYTHARIIVIKVVMHKRHEWLETNKTSKFLTLTGRVGSMIDIRKIHCQTFQRLPEHIDTSSGLRGWRPRWPQACTSPRRIQTRRHRSGVSNCKCLSSSPECTLSDIAETKQTITEQLWTFPIFSRDFDVIDFLKFIVPAWNSSSFWLHRRGSDSNGWCIVKAKDGGVLKCGWPLMLRWSSC